jgi:hypothetical protein
VAKIKINGEVFDWDATHHPMSEALAIEQATGQRYVDWEADLGGGSMRAMCGFVWLVWRRNGRDVPYEDIISGKVEIDLTDLLESLMESRQDEAPDPTQGAPRAP